MFRKEGHKSFIEQKYIEFILHSNEKLSEDEASIEKPVKSIRQLLYMRLFDIYDDVDEVLKDYLFLKDVDLI